MAIIKYPNINSNFAKSLNIIQNGNLLQQDCQEFFNHLLNLIEIENENFIQHNFYGEMTTSIKNFQENKDLTPEKFTFLQLPLPEDNFIKIDPILIPNSGAVPIRFEMWVKKSDCLSVILEKILEFVEAEAENEHSKNLKVGLAHSSTSKYEILEIVGGKITKIYNKSMKFENNDINLASLKIYQLPENCATLHDCKIVYHRKFIHNELNFHEKMASYPVLFGYPILISKNLRNLEEIQAKIESKLARMLTQVPDWLLGQRKTGDQNQESLRSNNWEIKSIDLSAIWSNNHSWLKFSQGEILTFENYVSDRLLAVDWNLENYLLKYIPGSDNLDQTVQLKNKTYQIEDLLEKYFSADVVETVVESPSAKSAEKASLSRSNSAEEKASVQSTTSSKIQINLTLAPKILLLHLQRAGYYSKNKTKINFKNRLILNQKWVYELKGFILHYGKNMHTGHFISVCKTSNSQWFVFNDSHTMKINNFLLGKKKMAQNFRYDTLTHSSGSHGTGLINSHSQSSNFSSKNNHNLLDDYTTQNKLLDSKNIDEIFTEFSANVYILAYEQVGEIDANGVEKEIRRKSYEEDLEEEEMYDEMRRNMEELNGKLKRDLDKMEMKSCRLM